MAWHGGGLIIETKKVYSSIFLILATTFAAIAGGMSTIPFAVNPFSRLQLAMVSYYHFHLYYLPSIVWTTNTHLINPPRLSFCVYFNDC